MSVVFYILLALTAAMIAWGVYRGLTSVVRDDKRRMRRRLSGETSVEQAEVIHAVVMTAGRDNSLSSRLGRVRMLAGLNRELATLYPSVRLTKFLAISGASGLGVFCLVALWSGSILAGLGGGAAAMYLPVFVVARKAGRRYRAFTEQLPDALDFLCRTLRAGHSLSTGIQMMGTELREPLAAEFRRCYDQHSLGQSLDECLRDLTIRIPSTDFAFFVTTVLIQRQTGGDLSQVLSNLSGTIRGRMRLRDYVKAKTAEGRFTGYILVAFPAVMFVIAYVMNPDYGNVLLHTTMGLKMLGAAVGLQMLGLFFIRKLTTVKV